jgi:hypothetical protein
VKTVYYRPEPDDALRGEIVQVQEGPVPGGRDGFQFVVTDVDGTITGVTHFVVGGEVVARSAAVVAYLMLPTALDVEGRVAAELVATDQFMVPDRPLPNAERKKWTAYRDGLRSLSDLKIPGSMILAWPARPDGLDPISDLRSRLGQT